MILTPQTNNSTPLHLPTPFTLLLSPNTTKKFTRLIGIYNFITTLSKIKLCITSLSNNTNTRFIFIVLENFIIFGELMPTTELEFTLTFSFFFSTTSFTACYFPSSYISSSQEIITYNCWNRYLCLGCIFHHI